MPTPPARSLLRRSRTNALGRGLLPSSEAGAQSLHIGQAGAQLLLLVGDNVLLWLLALEGRAPVARSLRMLHDEAQRMRQLGGRARRIVGPVVVGEHANMASLQRTQLNHHCDIQSQLFEEEVEERREIDHALAERTASQPVAFLARIDAVIFEMHMLQIGGDA